jgi:hypothetical protein
MGLSLIWKVGKYDCFVHHSILSRNGASGIPGAVQARQITTYMTERGEGINTIDDSPKDPKIAVPPKPIWTNY